MNYLLITNDNNLLATQPWKDQNIYCADSLSTTTDVAFAKLNQHDIIALDIETTGLNTWTDEVLLVALYHPEIKVCIVIHTETVDISILNRIEWSTKYMLAHNSAFELKFLLHRGINIKQTICTMVSEAKILQGSDYSMSLIETLKRRKVELPEGMDKDIRTDFVQDTFVLQSKHVIYNGGDVIVLHEVYEKQKALALRFNMHYFIYGIHNPLVMSLVKMELEGFIHDSKRWNEYADGLQLKCDALVGQLNDLMNASGLPWEEINADYVKLNEQKTKGVTNTKVRIDKLKNQLITMKEKGKTHLKSFKTAQESYVKAHQKLEMYESIDLSEFNGINWSSSMQVLSAFEFIGLKPLPKAKSATTHQVQPSASKVAREEWLLLNVGNVNYELMQTLDELLGLEHNIKSFGRKWVEKYTNPVTGRVHTTYRDNAATGRLTSGNAGEGLFNSQQIPAIKDYRHCFGTDPGYKIVTIDYTGAELCFMAAIAEDDKLVEISSGDMHSYFANKGWKAIYESRGQQWTDDDVISKQHHLDKRTGYKPMAFGTVYGLRDKKAGETLNVTVKEGQIAIDSIKKEIPKTIKMVEGATRFAKRNGYVIHNTRTNSRRWFTDVITAKKEGREMTFKERNNVEGPARNTRIQGSQADLVMEVIVAIDRWINLYKINAAILGTVHDEVIVKFHESIENWFPDRLQTLMERYADKYMRGFLHLRATKEIHKFWTK